MRRHVNSALCVDRNNKKVEKMSKFLRSVDPNLQKRIGVIADDGKCKIYKSLVDMPETERLEYICFAMAVRDKEIISPEQFTEARAAIKSMLIQQIVREM